MVTPAISTGVSGWIPATRRAGTPARTVRSTIGSGTTTRALGEAAQTGGGFRRRDGPSARVCTRSRLSPPLRTARGRTESGDLDAATEMDRQVRSHGRRAGRNHSVPARADRPGDRRSQVRPKVAVDWPSNASRGVRRYEFHLDGAAVDVFECVERRLEAFERESMAHKVGEWQAAGCKQLDRPAPCRARRAEYALDPQLLGGDRIRAGRRLTGTRDAFENDRAAAPGEKQCQIGRASC